MSAVYAWPYLKSPSQPLSIFNMYHLQANICTTMADTVGEPFGKAPATKKGDYG